MSSLDSWAKRAFKAIRIASLDLGAQSDEVTWSLSASSSGSASPMSLWRPCIWCSSFKLVKMPVGLRLGWCKAPWSNSIKDISYWWVWSWSTCCVSMQAQNEGPCSVPCRIHWGFKKKTSWGNPNGPTVFTLQKPSYLFEEKGCVVVSLLFSHLLQVLGLQLLVPDVDLIVDPEVPFVQVELVLPLELVPWPPAKLRTSARRRATSSTPKRQLVQLVFELLLHR